MVYIDTKRPITYVRSRPLIEGNCFLLQVPYTIVRTHSDILHRPVMSMGDGVWRTAPASPTQNFADGFAFAQATGSVAVLTMLQLRCHAANGLDAAVCNFTLAPVYSPS